MTEYFPSEEQLQESETRQGAALAIARLGTFEWVLDTGAVSLDARSREIFGFEPTEPLIAEQIFGRVHPDDLSAVETAAMNAVACGKNLQIDYRIVLDDGTDRWVQSLCEPIVSPDGRALRMVGVFADVTDRVQTEQRLSDSESRYRTLFEAVDAGFCVVEMKLRMTGGRSTTVWPRSTRRSSARRDCMERPATGSVRSSLAWSNIGSISTERWRGPEKPCASRTTPSPWSVGSTSMRFRPVRRVKTA